MIIQAVDDGNYNLNTSMESYIEEGRSSNVGRKEDKEVQEVFFYSHALNFQKNHENITYKTIYILHPPQQHY